MKRRTVLAGLGATAAAGVLGMPSILRAQAPISLNGAVQFNDDHAFNRALLRFEELVKKYYGKPINFAVLSKHSPAASSTVLPSNRWLSSASTWTSIVCPPLTTSETLG